MHLNILITGGTGFVGKSLTNELIKRNDHVFVMSRTPELHKNCSHITYIDYEYPVDKLPPIYAVINLAGDSLFGYWTKQKKASILTSRIKSTDKIVQIIKQMKTKPTVFISGSAIGFYGTSTDLVFTEKTVASGNDFLADVVTKWENTAKQIESMGIRTIYARFGLILGQEGALPLMTLPVKFGVGGKIGHGEQWISWIHIDDAVNLLIHCLTNHEITGPLNVTAPHPKRNKDFLKVLTKTYKRPYWLPTPSLILRIFLGEMSDLITKGQFVLPEKALANHFQFSYPNLSEALKQIRNHYI